MGTMDIRNIYDFSCFCRSSFAFSLYMDIYFSQEKDMTYDPRKYWQDRGKNYTIAADDDVQEETDNLIKLIQPLLNKKDDEVLEVGPGYGRLYHQLVGPIILPQQFSMCDISDSMREKCRQITGVLPESWDGTDLPYRSYTFDLVISFSVMLHVPPADIIQHFSECVRVSKKYLYIATYNTGFERTAAHAFEHAYDDFIHAFGLRIVDRKLFRDGLRVNWLLEKVI